MAEHNYKFSVIIPVYKAEKYLEETIKSVLKQTIGFQKNIQMILVNDGSPDHSKEICEKYVQKYPDNIFYLEQKNQGVSVARNNGLKLAKGSYINFLDADDTWEKNVFQKVEQFFKKNENEVDLIACRMKFFDAVNGFKHALDYKFREHPNMVVDINHYYDVPQLSMSSVFVKREIMEKYPFDAKLKYSEDSIICSKIILEKQKYALLNVVYNYRRRKEENSAIQTSNSKRDWYINTISYCYETLFNYSKEKFGTIIPYIQYQIMYDLQWRLTIPINHEILSKEEASQYLIKIKELLKQIEDSIICEQKHLTTEAKIYALQLKYDKEIKEDIFYKTGEVFFKDLKLATLYNNSLFIIRILELKKDKLQLEGQITTVLEEKDYEIYLEDNHKQKYSLQYFPMKHQEKTGIDRIILKPRGFKVEIPLKDIKNLQVVFCYKNTEKMIAKLRFEAYAKLHANYRYSYYQKGKYLITSKNDKIQIKKNNFFRHLKSELCYMFQLLKHKKVKQVIYRTIYYISKPFIRKPIWIISDRTDVADDNGQHFFEYLAKQTTKAKIYFAISKTAKEYDELKQVGRVLDNKSLKYKMFFLNADKIISSQANETQLNAFGKSKQCFKDLYQFDFIFLQHGIIKHDLSKWLHKQNKNIKLFVTSSSGEYESIIQGNYGYDKNVVKLTGLPRYDKLYKENEPQKQIVFMPTWRKKIAGREEGILKERIYNEAFKESEYCKFYNQLINEPRILEVMKQNGYTGKLYMHPNHKKQFIDFKGNETIQVMPEIESYQKEFKENKLLISDYSSVVFDFAYLKKPVIYAQFDIENFFEGQLYTKGYFEDETDGFGPVCYTYEDTVKAIIDIIKKDCRLEETYQKRIEGFYYKFDTKNCERVYQEILNLDKEV